MLGTASVAQRAAAGSMSGWLKIGLPRLDRNLARRVGALAPQLARLEQHGVEPLRILAFADGNGIGKHVEAAHAIHDAGLATRVAREARMCVRMDVLCSHTVALLEPRRAGRLARIGAARQRPGDLGSGQEARQRLARAERAAGLHLILADVAVLD